MVISGLQVGSRLPDGTGNSQLGNIRIHDYIDGSWSILLTFPNDFDPVWATELGMVSRLQAEFDSRNCKIIAISMSSIKKQKLFLNDVIETQEVDLKFPVIADESGDLLKSFGLVDLSYQSSAASTIQDTFNRRGFYSGTFILDPDLTIRFSLYYPISIGRNIYELIRSLDALQIATFNQIVTPANWKINDDVFIEPSMTTSAAKVLFPQGFHEIKSYFKITMSPGIPSNK